jgi:copper transport protein
MRHLARPHRSFPAACAIARPAWRSLLAGAILAALVVLLGAAAAAAHASLVESDPPPNAVLVAPPDAVTMRFTEPLERAQITARLFDQRGEAVPGAEARPGANAYEMVLALPPDLPDGTYSVFWRTLSSADGHPAQNYFAFTIGSAAAVAPPAVPADEASRAGPPQWAITLSRWLALVGLFALVAAWPLWVALIQPAVRPLSRSGPRITRRMRRFALVAVAVAGVGSLVALIVQAMALPAGTLLHQILSTLEDTRYGRLWLVRISLIAVLGLVLAACDWRQPRQRPILAGAAGLGSLTLPIPFSLVAHASAQTTGRTVAVTADMLHLLAASLWGGGLFVLAVVLLPALRGVAPHYRRAVLARAIPRFSALALACWAVLGLTGLYAGWLQVGSWHALRSTAYGQALLVKLAVLAGILTLAATNLLLLQRRIACAPAARAPMWTTRLRWTVGAEVALLLGVALAVGQLTSLQPARDAVATGSSGVSVRFALDGGEARLRLTPGTAGPNDVRLEVPDPFAGAGTEAMLKVTLPARAEMVTKDIYLARAPDGTFTHRGSELSMPGEWTFALVLREQGAAPVSAQREQVIAPAGTTVARPGEPWRFAAASGLAGLLLILVGICGSVAAVGARQRRLRLVSAGIGTTALVLGIVLLLQARIDPGTEAAAGTAHVARDNATPSPAMSARPLSPVPETAGRARA